MQRTFSLNFCFSLSPLTSPFAHLRADIPHDVAEAANLDWVSLLSVSSITPRCWAQAAILSSVFLLETVCQQSRFEQYSS